MEHPRPPVGISACLLGEAVRYDGGHKRDGFLAEHLAAHVVWVPVCPEVELGLGVPREPIRLVRHGDDVALAHVESDGELGERMDRWARERCAELEGLGLCGFVLKSGSPSCGPGDVPVHDPASGEVVGQERGRFARAVRAAGPDLPVAGEDELEDAARRERFAAAVFATARWRAAGGAGMDAAALGVYHARHRHLAASRDPGRLAALEAALATGDARRHREVFAQALTRTPTHDDHHRTLRQLAGLVAPRLGWDALLDLDGVLRAYAAGDVALGAAVRVVRDAARRHDPDGLGRDAYLHPHPEALGLLDDVHAAKGLAP